METAHVKSTPHPIVLAAAASVIVFSAVGTAAVMGWLPKSGVQADKASDASTISAPAANATATAAAQPVNTPTPVASAPVAQPAAKPAPRVVARSEAKPVAKPANHEPASAIPPGPIAQTAPQHPAELHQAPTEPTVVAAASPAPVSAPAPCRECGVIEAVNEIERPGEGSGVGAVAGGVVGAIAGKQVGGGRGRTAMSVLGAIGGAVAGNQIEKHARSVKSYDILIRFEDGTMRTISQSTQPSWRMGDRVRFVNGVLQPNV